MQFASLYRTTIFAAGAYVYWDHSKTRSSTAALNALEEARVLPVDLLIEPGLHASFDSLEVPSFHPSDATGFAANVFGYDDEKVLAIRGSETDDLQVYLDVVQADVFEIGLLGLSLSQATSLLNYVARLRAAAGDTTVPQFALRITADAPPDQPFVAVSSPAGIVASGGPAALHYWFERHSNAVGEGVVVPGDRFTVTGHSLGGHLAALALRLFPDLFDAAVTFNAANFDPATAAWVPDAFVDLVAGLVPASPLTPWVTAGFTHPQQLTETLVTGLFAPALPAPPALRFADVAPRLQAIVSEDSMPGADLDLVAGFLTGAPPVPPRELRTETNSHGLDPMLDSLALHVLLTALEPALTLETVAQLIDAASARPEDSLERLVTALDLALGGRGDPLQSVVAGPLGYDQDTGSFAARAAYHARLRKIATVLDDSPGTALDVLVGMDAVTLAARAEQSAGYLHALRALDPFALRGTPSLPTASVEAGPGPEYLLDRATYLVHELARRTLDAEAGVSGEVPLLIEDLALGTRLRVSAFDVHPLGAVVEAAPARRIVFGTAAGEVIVGTALQDHLYGDDGADILNGDTGEDVIDGGAGNDSLRGGAGRDLLRGGAGDDVLIGGDSGRDDGAADWLEGGAGHDRYVAGPGDRILDHDGEVQVWLGDELLALGGRRLQLQLADPAHAIYRASDEPRLWFVYLPVQRTLHAAGVTVVDFINGDLGIVLPEPLPEPPRKPLLVGTPGNDWLDGSPSGEELRGLGGDDTLSADAGDDDLFGEGGRDRLLGEAGDDRLFGGDGDDRLFGGDGDDYLAGDSGQDLLSGQDGNDILVAGEDTASNVLFGGAGHDVLLGGAGRDFLSGSGHACFALPDWAVTFLAPPVGDLVHDPRNLRLRGVSLRDRDEVLTPADTAADVLFGGDGDDFLLGGAGDDWLDGGDGFDVLAGGDGADTLSGGTGADHLRGGGGNDTVYGGWGDDVLIGHGGDESRTPDGNDRLEGGSGDDRLHGGPGRDVLEGGDGDDLLHGDEDDDVLRGGPGRDRLYGGDGEDVLDGGDGDDLLTDGAGDDRLYGGDGHDLLAGGDGADTLYGGAGNDRMLGGAGADHLYGGTGDDDLRGGSHNDVLQGGPGRDRMDGEAGNDLYVIHAGDGLDEILDGPGDDGLWLVSWPDLSTLTTRLDGVGLVLELSAEQRILVMNYGDGTPLDYLRFGTDGYLDGAHLLSPAASGRVFEPAPEVTVVAGTAGDDLIFARAGHRVLAGGVGDDRYVLATGAASAYFDLRDGAGANVLQFAPAVTLDDLTVTADEGRYTINVGAATMRVTPGEIARYVFSDGLQIGAEEFDLRHAGLLDPAPRLLNPVGGISVFAGETFALRLPHRQFFDLSPREGLAIDVTGAQGAPLPDWLGFDPLTLRVSGSPAAVGSFVFEVSARDRAGQLARDILTIDVLPGLAAGEVAIFDPALLPLNHGTLVQAFGHDGPAPRLYAVGDLNADGIDDFLLPALARVVFGRREGFGARFVAPEADGYHGFALAGLDPAALPALGADYPAALPHGDFNGDGIDDVMLGDRLLAGRDGHFAATVEVVSLPHMPEMVSAAPGVPPPLRWPDGQPVVPGFLVPVGDVNGDGQIDFAGSWSANELLVIYGAPRGDLRPRDITQPGPEDGYRIVFTAYPGVPGYAAADALEYAGWARQVTPLGDLDGDGHADFALGGAPYLFATQSAFVPVLLGAAERPAASLALGELDGIHGFLARIPAVTTGVAAPRFAQALGDINGDGYDDALIGSAFEPAGAYIMYGRERFAGSVAVFTPGDDLVRVDDATAVTVYAGAGDDRVEIGPRALATTVFGGSGNDIIGLAVTQGTHRLAGGPGFDRYEIAGRVPSGRYEVTIADEDGPSTITINVTAGGSLWLRKGSVALDFGEGGPIVHLESVDLDALREGPRPFKTLELADGTRWSWEQLLARGFDLDGSAQHDVLDGTSVSDRIRAGAGDDYVSGGRGDDILFGGPGIDVLIGGAGRDQLHGGSGDDVLNGGPGDDYLAGGSGDDTYHVELGGGYDRVAETHAFGHDRVTFGPGLPLDRLRVAAAGAGFDLRFEGLETGIYVPRAPGRADPIIDAFGFADGSWLADTDIAHLAGVTAAFGAASALPQSFAASGWMDESLPLASSPAA